MLDLLRAMVINIAIVVLLTLFLELLIPSGELRRYLRLIMGLLLLSVVLNPVLTIFNLAQDEPVIAWEGYQSDDATQVLKDGEDLAQNWQKQASQDYNSGIEGQINELVTGIAGIVFVSTEVESDQRTGEIKKITLSIEKEARETDAAVLKAEIVNKVSGYYKIDDKKIHVNMI